MQINQSIQDLVHQLQRLELHAAHSGRVILNTLVKFIKESQIDNLDQLVDSVKEACSNLLLVLPPYAPALNSINRVMVVLEDCLIEGASVELVQDRISMLELQSSLVNIHEQIAEHLVSVLPKPVRIYTHTLSETLLGVLLELHKRQFITNVYITESRPNNDGWVTAQRLADVGVETYLTIDAGFPMVLDQVDVMLSGTEIISLDGSVVSKVGVYPAAVFCKELSLPVYIVADTNKILPFSVQSLNMTPISLNDIGMLEVPKSLKVVGSYFDTTPAKFITGYITENGIFNIDTVAKYIEMRRVSPWLKSKLNDDLQSSIKERLRK